MRLAKVTRIAGFFLFVILLAWGVIRLWPIIMPFFLALLFAYILQPAVRGIQKLEVSAGAAIAIVYAYFFVLLAAIVSLCLPILNTQFTNMFRMLPQLFQQVQLTLSRAVTNADSALLRELIDGIMVSVSEVISAKLMAIFDDSAAMIAIILRVALYMVLTPFLAYYILRDKVAARRTIAAWMPIQERGELRRLAGDIDHLLRQFVLGYLLVAMIVALLSAIFYWCIGLNYALALGLIMGIADIIPYFGPFIGAIPAVIVALSADTGKAVITVAGLIVIQQLESIVITPRIMGDKVGLHPLTTILAVLAGGWLFGVLGTILAVPVAAAGLLILRYLWSRIVGAKIM